jgi:uncharacterized protein (DUF934 family)
MQIVRNRRVSENHWQHVPEGGLAPGQAARLQNSVIVALADWRLHKRELLARGLSVGVRLGAGDDVDELVEDLEAIALVALEFESFTEGRPYTQARLLRERYGYSGEIRAVGDVSRDRLAFMERCGINAYELRDGCDPEGAAAAFAEISDVYQPAADGRPVISSRRP